MKCIEELGLLKYLGDNMSTLIKACNEEDRLAIALLILTILSAVISSLIDNIPFTTAMIPIVIQLNEQADVNKTKSKHTHSFESQTKLLNQPRCF